MLAWHIRGVDGLVRLSLWRQSGVSRLPAPVAKATALDRSHIVQLASWSGCSACSEAEEPRLRNKRARTSGPKTKPPQQG
jgi:hypothetical protein